MHINDYVTTYEHPRFGLASMAGFPIGLSETPGATRSPASEFKIKATYRGNFS